MFDRISVMEANMKSDEVDYFPDIFKVSSEVIVDIMKEYSDVPMPEYVSVLSHSDYFGERVVGRNSIEKIIRAWENEPKQFTVDRKKNKLIYTYPQNANTYGLQYINDELPPKLNSHINSHTLSMDLDAAEEFFGRKFKKRFWR